MADVKLPGYSGTGFKFANAKVADVINALVPYIYVFAGIVLLFMLISGGIGLMTAAGNPDKIKAGQGRVTAGLIGFLIIFISYFVVQIVELILGISIL